MSSRLFLTAFADMLFQVRVETEENQFMEAFNNHKVSTEQNWSPYQMWVNGMLHPDNPLAKGDLDSIEDDLDMYGYDPNGPSPIEESNVVIVGPIEVNDEETARNFVLQRIDPLRHSTEMGVDIYSEALDLILQFIQIA